MKLSEENDSILELVALLSPDTEDFVKRAMDASGAEIFYHESNPLHQGVYFLVHWEGTNYAYASFIHDVYDPEIHKLIETTIRPYIDRKESLCFNVYGQNTSIIELVRSLGFVTDMEGFELAFQGDTAPEVPPTNLVIQTFDHSLLGEFVQLFEQGYYTLNKDNGWNVNWYSQNSALLSQQLESKNQTGELYSFWVGDRLVGTYIVDTNYIQDLIVHPEYQRLGYGKLILCHAVSFLMKEKGHSPVCLRVVKSNTGALRFYLNNQFVEIASFAEHTFPKK